jgi:sigma-B regulation protein RsbU (phosphoserine phosphatase)
MTESKSPDSLEDQVRRLRLAVEELTVLNDIATAIGSTLSLDKVMELVVRKCIKHFHAEQGAVMLIDPEDKTGPLRTMIRRADRSSAMLPYRLDTQLTGWMLKHKKPLLVNDLAGDARFSTGGEDSQAIRSVLSAPLLYKGSITGVLNVFNKKSQDGFTEADRRLLAIVATQSAQVIENARLYEEEQTLLGIQEEMRVAYRIQTGLLPQEAPEIPGYEIAGRSIPAALVGGDYYDFIETTDGGWGICLGDVSGKGMPAALLMANLQATLRSQILQGLAVGRCLECSNRLIFRSTTPDRFATLFYGVLDHREHRLRFANAGHNPPLLFRHGAEPLPLKTGGTVLGSFETATYEEGEVCLQPDDVLMVYSDGISEATDEEGRLFGEACIADIVVSNLRSSVSDLLGMVLDAAQQHAGASLKDDMTGVVIRRLV